MVVLVRSLAELNQIISNTDATRLIILDFYADWCPPCRNIAPFFDQLSTQYKNAAFLKVNVDQSRDISTVYSINAMPTFVFLKQGREVARLRGGDAQALQQAIDQHYTHAALNPLAANDIEKGFLSQFVAVAEKVTHYSDIVNKTLALSLIPSEELIENATIDGVVNHFKLAKGKTEKSENNRIELLQWFKVDFFTWCDTPICPTCQQITLKESLDGGSGAPNAAEEEYGANRVEVYNCGNCHQKVRFPRYNNPQKLLETRTGRCGEWANCFALMAASMDFDIRFISDVTDHVWCELWIPEMDRWVHCDPCENAIDTPYMYEKGWNKKLSYIIAFGVDHVADVTWSYSAKHSSIRNRRTRVREPVLANFLEKLSKRMARVNDMSEERAVELRRRRTREIVSNIHIGKKVGDSNSYEGRTTGSLEWRIARGELGASPKKKPSIVIRPNDEELASKVLKISYNPAKDLYTRGSATTKGWSSLIFKSKDVQRKVEADWKMVYLCRKEDKDEGEVTWAIDLTGVKVLKASVKVKGATEFENGSLALSVCADDICMPIPKSGELIVPDPPSALFKVTAHFTGGIGSNAFQHAQLFRTGLDSKEDQLIVEIELA